MGIKKIGFKSIAFCFLEIKYPNFELMDWVNIWMYGWMDGCMDVYNFDMFEGSLEVKLPTMWTDENHSQEEAELGRNSDVEKIRK